MSILVNGSPTLPFNLERGLRQGDPLSPILFVLVAESLNSLLMKARSIDLIEGILVGKDNVNITHLQYADDKVIFSPAKEENIQNIYHILNCFVVMSGLYINYNKTALIAVCCHQNWAMEMADSLQCKLAKLSISYLGIPLGANPRTIST